MVDQLKEGGTRLLTSGEIALAKTVFGSTIDHSMVWIHKGSYLPFDLQDKDTAMTPNGELYFRDWYRDDSSATLPFLQHLFIHEMSHVWQRTKGMNVIARGLISWMVSYRYRLDGDISETIIRQRYKDTLRGSLGEKEKNSPFTYNTSLFQSDNTGWLPWARRQIAT